MDCNHNVLAPCCEDRCKPNKTYTPFPPRCLLLYSTANARATTIKKGIAHRHHSAPAIVDARQSKAKAHGNSSKQEAGTYRPLSLSCSTNLRQRRYLIFYRVSYSFTRVNKHCGKAASAQGPRAVSRHHVCVPYILQSLCQHFNDTSGGSGTKAIRRSAAETQHYALQTHLA